MVANPAYQGLTVANRLTRRKVRNPVTGNVNKKRQVTRPEEEWTVVGQPGELTPALVEPDLWRNANEHLSANRGSRTRNAQAPMLLRNRVYCAVCGGLLHAEHSTRPGRRSYYRCKASHPEQYRTPNVQGRTPASLAVAQADLDDWVWSTVRATLVDRREVVTEIRRRLEGQRDAPVRSEAAQLEERVAKLERPRTALLRLFTEAEGAMPWATIAPELARLESEHAEALVLLDATRERLGKSAADLARLDGLDTVARRLGPMLVDPDLDTRVQVVAELGLTVRATRLHQTLEWTLPLASGEQSGWAALIDLSHVEEPDEATRAALLAEDLAEVFRDDPDEGTSGRGADRRSGSPAGSRPFRWTSTSTGSPTAGTTSGRRRRSRRWPSSRRSCR